MDTHTLRPTSLVGIKSLARDFKKSQQIAHSIALDQASKQAGYANFRDAHRSLNQVNAGNHAVAQTTGLYLTVYWFEASGESGRETLHIDYLPHWPQLLERHQINNCYPLSRFQGQAPDHLVCRVVADSPSVAQRYICQAARELQFMHATGLISIGHGGTSLASRQLERPALPGGDHTSMWATRNGVRVAVDEPYPLSYAKQTARDQWAAKFDFTIEQVNWSKYAPHLSSHLYLVCKDAELTKSIATKLARYSHTPISEVEWKGLSDSYRPVFASPMQLANSSRARPPVASNRASRLTLPMGRRFRRPTARMPIDAHTEIADLLKKVEGVAASRAGIMSRVAYVKTTLDDWIQAEYSAIKLPFEQFSGLYYGQQYALVESKWLTEQQHVEVTGYLNKVRQLLTAHYPACAPLQEVLQKLDLAGRSLASWAKIE